MAQGKKGSVIPFYAVAAIWVGYAALFDLYAPLHFVTAAVISGAAFLLLRAVCGAESAAPVKEEDRPKAGETKGAGNPEIDKMIADGDKAVSEMRRLNDAIKDPKISAQIDRLEAVSLRIFDAVKEDPKKLPQIRRFMDYYLPTTLKLLNAYDRMGSAGVSGENIGGTMKRVEEMMDTIVTAFEKQLDGLYGADALDLSADMTVLETMMAREGLAGEQMKAETTKNDDGTDIKLEL